MIADVSELFSPTTGIGAQTKGSNELGMEDFLELMVAQLENQDPTKPLDNAEFLGQIAQFTTVSGIEDLNTSFGDLSASLFANQTVQAATLVGRQVISESNVGVLAEGELLSGTINLPQASPSVRVFVQDMSGRLVHSQSLGSVAGGDFKVYWDGADGNGGQLPAGQYRISAEALIDGQTQAVSVFAHNRVESVSVGSSGGTVMNLLGGGQVSLSEVKGFL